MYRKPAAPRAPRFAANIEVLTVGRPDAGKPLQDFLSSRFRLSRRAAKAIIDGRSVWVNRRCVWIAHHQLKTGDTVEVPKAVVSAAKRQSSAEPLGRGDDIRLNAEVHIGVQFSAPPVSGLNLIHHQQDVLFFTECI